MSRLAIERRMFEESFVCAPIDARSGPVGAHPQEEGHCSNAGGLSAVLRDPLYSNGRIHVLAAKRAREVYTERSTPLS
jgi:hypothetical protein